MARTRTRRLEAAAYRGLDNFLANLLATLPRLDAAPPTLHGPESEHDHGGAGTAGDHEQPWELPAQLGGDAQVGGQHISTRSGDESRHAKPAPARLDDA